MFAIADDAVFRGRRAAHPFMTVGKADRQIGAGPREMQGMEALAVQPVGALTQGGVVRCPVRDRIIVVDARRGENRVRKFRHRAVRAVVRKHQLRPGRARPSHDIPVDVEADDFLERRLVGHGVGLVGAGDFLCILTRQQHRIVADNGEPRGVGRERLRHALIEPAGGAIKTRVRPESVA